MTVAGFIQITIKEDLIVKGKYEIPPRYLCGKTLERSRSHIIEVEPEWLTCGAARPQCQATRPLVGPTINQLPTSVSHHL